MSTPDQKNTDVVVVSPEAGSDKKLNRLVDSVMQAMREHSRIIAMSITFLLGGAAGYYYRGNEVSRLENKLAANSDLQEEIKTFEKYRPSLDVYVTIQKESKRLLKGVVVEPVKNEKETSPYKIDYYKIIFPNDGYDIEGKLAHLSVQEEQFVRTKIIQNVCEAIQQRYPGKFVEFGDPQYVFSPPSDKKDSDRTTDPSDIKSHTKMVIPFTVVDKADMDKVIKK